jgi:hypothetical protein
MGSVGQGDCMERRQAAVCGRYCGGCEPYVEGRCCGCGYQLGLTCRGECVVFQCCVCQRGLEHCGLCQDFPCEVFLALAEPLEVARRYRALLRRAEIGTAAWIAEQREKQK